MAARLFFKDLSPVSYQEPFLVDIFFFFLLRVHSLDVFTFAGDHDHLVKVPADGIIQALQQRPGSWVARLR